MSGCSKRCKHGIVKFAQTIFKLITGTLSKDCQTSEERLNIFLKSLKEREELSGVGYNSGLTPTYLSNVISKGEIRVNIAKEITITMAREEK